MDQRRRQGRKRWTAVFGAGLALAGLARAGAQAPMPFQDPSLPTAQRVDDLVARMTLPEKAVQMGTDAPAIARLGVPAYFWRRVGTSPTPTGTILAV